MSDAPRYVTLRDYLRVLRQHRVQIVLVTILFAGAAFLNAARQEPVYVAQSSLSFQEPTQDSALVGTPQAPLRTPEQRAAESAATVAQIEIFQRVRESLDTDLSAEQLQALTVTRTEAQTNFVVIETRASDPKFAAALANEAAERVVVTQNRAEQRRYAQAAAAQRDQLEELGGEGDRFVRSSLETRVASLESLAEFAEPVQVAQPANVPGDPVSPQPVRDTVLGLLLGLTLGILIAFVRDALDRRLRNSHEVEDHLGLPLLGHVSDDALGRRVLPSNGRPALTGPELESFRILRMNLEFLDVDRPPRTIAVTSSLPEEGKTTVATSLAYTSALAGKRAVIVECDLRRPALSERLGLERAPGLTDCLAAGSEPAEVIQRVFVDALPSEQDSTNGASARFPAPAETAARRSGRRLRLPGRRGEGNGEPSGKTTQLATEPAQGSPEAATADVGTDSEVSRLERRYFSVIMAGSPAPRPAEALGSQRLREFLTRLESEYDVVVLDTSPLLAVVDTLELIPQVDGVLVCVRIGRTTRDQAIATKAVLDRFPLRPTGLVATGVKPGEEIYYGHYSYAYAYGEHDL